jgi:hypothetical protein
VANIWTIGFSLDSRQLAVGGSNDDNNAGVIEIFSLNATD